VRRAQDKIKSFLVIVNDERRQEGEENAAPTRASRAEREGERETAASPMRLSFSALPSSAAVSIPKPVLLKVPVLGNKPPSGTLKAP